eukprot:GHVU01087784.1.p1 GENE.GHVU01087784.1~~GHVU01087784.1.p1  ORF type:complete len:171 (+),score=20.05 GHVU01087784.1:217-729(+)
MAQVEEILDIVIRKPDRCFNLFLESLIDTDQAHIAGMLKEKEKDIQNAPSHPTNDAAYQADGRQAVHVPDIAPLELLMEQFLVMHVVPHLAMEVMQIAVLLGVPMGRIKAMRAEHAFDTQNYAIALLKEWTRKPNYSVSELIHALDILKRRDLKFRLEKALKEDPWNKLP